MSTRVGCRTILMEQNIKKRKYLGGLVVGIITAVMVRITLYMFGFAQKLFEMLLFYMV